jgi:hypothetical protein
MAYSSGTFSRLYDFTDDRDNGIRIQAARMDAELDGMATGLTTAILKDGSQTTTAVVPFAYGISIVDNQSATFGTTSDYTLQYDETTRDSLFLTSNVEGAAFKLTLAADQGDDASDEWQVGISTSGVLTIGNDIASAQTYVSQLTLTPHATVASSTTAVLGNLTVGGSLSLGSAVIAEAELEMLDGITAGTVIASKALVADANIDITGGRNITITGELAAATLDISGNIDIDGTANLDIVDIDGAVNIAATTTIDGANKVQFRDTGIYLNSSTDGQLDIVADTEIQIAATTIDINGAVALNGAITGATNITLTGELDAATGDFSGDVDVDGTLEADAITVNGTALATVIAGTTVTNATNSAHVLVTDNESTNEENLIAFVEGATSTTGNVGLEMDGNFAYNPSTGTVSATVFKGNIDAVDGDFDGTLEADAITIGGTAVGSIFSPIAGGTGILTTGALNAGSITSGFGAIDNGASAITTTGVGSFGSLDISGDIDVDGTTNLDVVDIDGALTQDGGAVFNEAGADVDFRVESDTIDHALFVQGSDGAVGINTSSPTAGYMLHVGGSSGVHTKVKIEATTATGQAELDLSADPAGVSYLNLGDEDSHNIGYLGYFHSDNSMRFQTNSAERMRIDVNGNLLVGRTDNPSAVTNCIYALGNYGVTTGSGANVFINSEGLLFRSTSSLRYKNTIEDATHGLTELLTLRPVTYKAKNGKDTVFGGLIAEEVHDAGLTEFVEYNDEDQPDALHYGNMVSLCIKAIQEQQATIETLKARITALEGA